MGAVARSLATFRDRPEAAGWCRLPFFAGGADEIARRLDARISAGAVVLPAAADIFAGLALTPLAAVKVVILGQDPYPTPGDANGLAFSYVGPRRLPASLKAILAEMAADCGVPLPASGDLTPWARQGVLLLNTALTVEAGQAGAHMRLGWAALADEATATVSAERPAAVFLFWGAAARQRAALVDRGKHLVLESGHPSPLNRERDFRGSRPFSRANAFLVAKGERSIDWALPPRP